MRKRFLIGAGILFGCFLLVFAVLAMLPPRPGVTKANFDRVKSGMTYKEVDAIFRGDRLAEDYRPRSPLLKKWRDPNGAEAWVIFAGADGVVAYSQWHDWDRGWVARFQDFIDWPRW